MLLLKYDQLKTLLKRIDEGRGGPQNRHLALYIISHQPTRGRNSVFILMNN